MTGKIVQVVLPVEQAEREYLDALRAERDAARAVEAAMSARADAGWRLFLARQAWCAEHNAALSDEPGGPDGYLIACRDCLRAVRPSDGGHEVRLEPGEMVYAECRRGGAGE